MPVFLFIFSILIIPIVSNLGTSIQVQDRISFNSVNSINITINITNNDQLALQASSGNGSSINPYIIENIVINSCQPNINGVSIQNTNKYFVLRNITISHCSTGFLFFKVTFGTILNCTAIENNYGFELLFSSNNNMLINDTAINSYYDGFDIFSSSNNNILTNDLSTNNNYGFYFLPSCNNTILTNDTATNNNAGFYIDTSTNTILTNNSATSNLYDGFYLSSSNDNVIINNTATNNDYGFELSSSTSNVLKFNTGQYNRIYDYLSIDSTNTLLIYNTFSNSVSTTISYSPPPASISSLFDLTNILNILELIVIIITIFLEILIFMYFRRKLTNRSTNTNISSKDDDAFHAFSQDQSAQTSQNIVKNCKN